MKLEDYQATLMDEIFRKAAENNTSERLLGLEIGQLASRLERNLAACSDTLAQLMCAMNDTGTNKLAATLIKELLEKTK